MKAEQAIRANSAIRGGVHHCLWTRDDVPGWKRYLALCCGATFAVRVTPEASAAAVGAVS